MAYYVPSAVANVAVGENEKRDSNQRDRGREHGHVHGHHAKRGPPGHKWLHSRAREYRVRKKTELVMERAVGDMVTATIDGQKVSWVNQYAGPGRISSTSPPEISTPTVGPMQSIPFEKIINEGSSITTTLATQAPSYEKTDTGNSAGKWVRQGYYQAARGVAEGITFLNHFGGVNGVPGTTAGGSAFVLPFRLMIKCDKSLKHGTDLVLHFPMRLLMVNLVRLSPKFFRTDSFQTTQK